MSHKDLKSPVSWFGGKSYLARHIIPLFPKHDIYCEVFGGSGAPLFAKDPSPVEVYNDLDSGLVNFFRVLRDPKEWKRLQELCALTPYSREEYEYCRKTWETNSQDPVDQAYRWFVVARWSFSGIFGNSWGFSVAKSSRGMAGCVSKWLGAIERLAEVHDRTMRLQIEHDDFRRIIPRYDTPETLFYCDPPYIPETRKGGCYPQEMTTEDHEELVGLLLGIQGRAVLSGYAHTLYEPLIEAGWARHDFEVVCNAAGRTRASGLQGVGNVLAQQKRTESVWVSPPRDGDESKSEWETLRMEF